MDRPGAAFATRGLRAPALAASRANCSTKRSSCAAPSSPVIVAVHHRPLHRQARRWPPPPRRPRAARRPRPRRQRAPLHVACQLEPEAGPWRSSAARSRDACGSSRLVTSTSPAGGQSAVNKTPSHARARCSLPRSFHARSEDSRRTPAAAVAAELAAAERLQATAHTQSVRGEGHASQRQPTSGVAVWRTATCAARPPGQSRAAPAQTRRAYPCPAAQLRTRGSARAPLTLCT